MNGTTALHAGRDLGEKLPNGYRLIALSAAKAHVWVALAVLPAIHGDNPRYATWECDRPGDGSDTRWGHYHDNIFDAVEDYRQRAQG